MEKEREGDVGMNLLKMSAEERLAELIAVESREKSEQIHNDPVSVDFFEFINMNFDEEESRKSDGNVLA